ncbi:helix-turn-helix domain-containing protein [Streptomyces griseorubiginosus]|uniref:nSTAND1 domain-containing NTPase n=1 Tax=Streptomyces griseorubiginosus TaxID=67304 RepID=UPI002E81CF4C|nr:helix-turn-helix domain-containing protein [Streptomyces griseorubiginosus]WUB48872.1 helix-turn-helix domain-containing protein [Streptomyces griseorubiginosus]WUB57399.1 helix-turn-helix domain-containing protein [Streptomyces griseorubiginosus]
MVENPHTTESTGYGGAEEGGTGGAPADFPSELRRLRHERGLSLTALAQRVHYSKGYLSKIENGSKPATADVGRRCDEALLAGGALLRLVPEPLTAERNRRPEEKGRECPYRGLAAFTAQDARWFFGRERMTAELVDRLFQRVGSGPLLLVAPSGAGKSSLLNAGLVPALRNGALPMAGSREWPVVAFTPTARPLGELLSRTAEMLGEDLGVTADELREDPSRLVTAVARARRRASAGNDRGSVEDRMPPGKDAGDPLGGRIPPGKDADDPLGGRIPPEKDPAAPVADRTPPGKHGPEPVRDLTPPGRDDREPPPDRLVLLVDQFEEVFTLCPDEGKRRAFVRALCALSTPEPADGAGARAALSAVVLGMRADFTGRCLDHPELAAVFAAGLFVLRPMTVRELRESITRPARQAGLVLAPGLVQLLLRDVGLRSDPAAAPQATHGQHPADGAADRDESAPAPPGALPLLSHALMATWQRGDGRTLTITDYEDSGGIQGAVARTAETCFARLYPAEQTMIRQALVRLVQLGDGSEATRRRLDRAVLLAQLPDPAAAATALDAFVRARLITVDRDTVEITHEALLHVWPRLRGWIHADRAGLLIRQQLADAAAEWEREGRDPLLLYRGPRLSAVTEWAREVADRTELGPREAEFYEASRAEELRRQESDRRQGRRQRRLLAVLAALLGLAVTAGGLAYQQRSEALRQSRVTLSQSLAVRSTAMASAQPEAALLLAAEAYGTEPTTEARGALLSTQAQYFSGRLTGHSGPVNAVAFAPGGRLLASGSSDGTVRVWRTAERRQTAVLAATGKVRSVAFGPGGRTLAAGVVGAAGGAVRVWDVTTRRVLADLTTDAPVRAVAYAPDGRTLAAADSDGTVTLWRATGAHRPIATFTGHRDSVDALAYSPDGRTLASGGSDHTVRLWDTVRHRPLAVLAGHTAGVLGVAFAPDGRTLASGGADRVVRLWDRARLKSTAALTGTSDDVNAVAFTPDSTTVIGAAGDGAVRLWDVRSHRITTTLSGHTDYVLGVATDPGGTLLATAGFDESVVLWDLSRSALTARPFTEVWHAAFSPDGRTLAAADADHTVRLWDVGRRRSPAVLRGHSGAVFSVAFAPDGRSLASAGSGGAVRLWDVAGRRPLAVLRGHSGAVFSVAFAPDGRTLASAGPDGTVRLWDVARGRLLTTLTGHTDFVNAVAFSPDGRTLASASDDLTVRLWDVPRRLPLTTLTGHTGAVRAVAFAPDGQTLASSGNDGTVRLWDPAGHRVTAALTGHTGSVRGLAFAPDGRTLASSGNDGTVRLWDTRARGPLATLTGHTSAVWGVTFAPDGQSLASSGIDGTVRLWNPDVRDLAAEVCRLTRAPQGPRWQQLMTDLPASPCRKGS